MTWYPFQDCNQRYIFLKYYNCRSLDTRECFIIVMPEKNPTERLVFYFASYAHTWRIISGPALNSYRKKLDKNKIIASNNQFTLYSDSSYIKIFCRYSGHHPDTLKHLCFDLGTVIVETIFRSDVYFALCLGEAIL